MWPFGNRSKLLRELDRLAFYNDKGIAHLRHDDAQIDSERSASMIKINRLVTAIGREAFPQRFIAALDSGEVSTDLNGDYLRLVKTHFRRRTR